MSKTGRGILRDPGPYFCLYSPECVEEKFSEVLCRTLHRTRPDRPGIAAVGTPASGPFLMYT